jgi:hypothetical protein
MHWQSTIANILRDFLFEIKLEIDILSSSQQMQQCKVTEYIDKELSNSDNKEEIDEYTK